jgi:hypothetical protein
MNLKNAADFPYPATVAVELYFNFKDPEDLR